ncbi:MAG: RNA polymerase sigma factor [Acidimicrobiales bacterium]
MADPDAELVAAAQRGDRSALDRLLRRHVDRVHGLARRLMGSEADAADAAQEALIAAVRGLPRFDGRSTFSTWLYRITTNSCLDELRRRSRRPDPRAELPEPRAGGPTVASAVSDRLDIESALRTLPMEFRTAVVLRDLCELDYAEIADVLGIPPGTVRSRIARGRAALSRALGNPEPTTERPSNEP